MGFEDGHLVGTYQILNQKLKICLTKCVTFLNKSHSEWDKVEKPAFVPIRDERAPKNYNSNNNYSAISDSVSDKE